MKTITNYLKALRRAHTYDPRRNLYLWFGFLWGLPIPIYSILLDPLLAEPTVSRILQVIRDHPLHLFFLAHPFLFAVTFGAMGTVRHSLERENCRLIDELTNLATTDPLTGLHNRRHVMDEIDKALRRSQRSEQSFAIVLFDLDRFKAVNDTRGHAVGDAVLRGAAQALRGVTRQGDVLGRYGGDEFLLLTYGDLPSVLSVAQRAEEVVGKEAGLGISAGVGRYPEDGATAEALIRAADTALSVTKKRHHEKEDPARR